MMRLVSIAILAVALVVGFLIYKQEQSLPDSLSSSAPTAAEPISPALQQEAKQHINRITEGSDTPISIEKADNFVTAEQLLQLPEVKTAKSAELIAVDDSTVAAAKPASAPTTIEEQANAEPSQTTETAPEQAVAAANNATFAVTSHLSVITTPKQAPAHIAASVEPLAIENRIQLQELLDSPDDTEQKVYFIHAVNGNDREGLWGIIQHGLMRTFTEGLSLPGLETKVYATIPKEADEKLADQRSSFLGRVLKSKVDRTYIYNYEKGILGDNPDLIKPGQQLIIVTFTEQELIGIYHHFVNL